MNEKSEYSPYSKYFDRFNPNWSPDRDENLLFLKSVQSRANDKLKLRGYLFLNDVYGMLGLPRTTQGTVVGWFLGHDRRSFVDFLINVLGTQSLIEDSILLDFNVDGEIVNLIKAEEDGFDSFRKKLENQKYVITFGSDTGHVNKLTYETSRNVDLHEIRSILEDAKRNLEMYLYLKEERDKR